MNKNIDQEKFNKLLKIALRTARILRLIEQAVSANEIAHKVNCDRQLVDYYIKAVTKK